MANIRAVYENGVFRPLDPVALPEGTEVELRVLRIVKEHAAGNIDDIYDVLDRRHDTGHTYFAATTSINRNQLY